MNQVQNPHVQKKQKKNILFNNNLEDGVKPHNLCIKYGEETEEERIEIPLNRCDNILNNYSDYEIYDENNNCMLTNLNKFGLTYFNINDDETVDEYINNEICLDATPNDLELVFGQLTASFCHESSQDDKLVEFNSINENVNLDEIKKQAINKDALVNMQLNVSNELCGHLEENISTQKCCNQSLEKLRLVNDDIEQVLKCNLISKICVADNVYDRCNDEYKNLNETEFPETVNEVFNNDVEHIDYDNIILVHTESKDCLLANDRESRTSGRLSDNSDACSYHSSDFEFIDEEEARKECKLYIEEIDIVKNETENKSKDVDNNIIHDNILVPKQINNISVPSGDEYHNLFLAQSVPYPCINIEHKAISSIKGMDVSQSPINNLHVLLQEDAKYRKEADESIQIILSMYPNENSTIHLHQS